MYTKDDVRERIHHAVEAARAQNPLVGSITNTVTVNFVANAQLAVGGSAAMVYLPDEGAQLANMASAFYLNLGTLLPVYEQTIPETVEALVAHKTPWVLDPVGIGIGSLRAKLLHYIKDNPPSIVRGNASEIIALARLWDLTCENTSDTAGGPRGVDAADSVDAARPYAVALARFTGGAVCVSGQSDMVTDGETVVRLQGGSHFMEKITGAGCSLGGVCAVYAAVSDPFSAALAATALYNVAGMEAEQVVDAAEPASFQVELLDELFHTPATKVAACELSVEAASEVETS